MDFTKRIFITVQYDGTAYNGWQRQSNGVGIQAVIEDALESITGCKTVVFGSGRTDAGAHAYGQTAHFDTVSRLAPERITAALNAKLPPDIRVTAAREVDNGFHARYSAAKKTYVYKLYTGDVDNVFLLNRAYRVRGHLDLGAMRKAAAHLIGHHYFDSFMAADSSVKTTDRTIFECAVYSVQCTITDKEIITVKVSANGFLYNMVRIITAMLIKAGQGTLDPDTVPDIIAARDRKAAPDIVPAYGLYLLKVEY